MTDKREAAAMATQNVLLAVLPRWSVLRKRFSLIDPGAAQNLLEIFEAAIEFIVEQELPSKSHHAGSPDQLRLFENEGVYVQHPDGTIFKWRYRFEIRDGDQLTQQRADNIRHAIEKKKAWDWEWGVIKPYLEANPGWVYEDALNHLKATTGLPEPPDFTEDV